MRDTPQEDLLQLPPAEMRRLGYRVVDMIVAHLEGLRDKPVARGAKRPLPEEKLREPIPEAGTDVGELLRQLEDDVFGHIMHLDHPRFFAYVPGPSNYVSVLADALATGFNVFSGCWLEAPSAAMIELVTVDWLRQLCGLPHGAGGLFVSGGSVANLTALAVARQVKLQHAPERAVLYCSDQTHASIRRAVKILGFRADQLKVLSSDDRFRLVPEELAVEIERDRAAGKAPFCVVANAGTTNTGAADPIADLADLCGREALWLHADAAYGGASLLSERGRTWLRGVERVDSLTIDPHKWLFQPYEIGCLLVRRAEWLQQAFKLVSTCGVDTATDAERVNFCDVGIQLTRRFRALKLWLSMKAFGIGAFRAAVERGIALAETAQAIISDLETCELVTPAQMGVVTFRYVGKRSGPQELNALNRKIVRACIADGFAMVSATELRGKVVLRLCTINPRTREDDIRETLRRLAAFGDRLSAC